MVAVVLQYGRINPSAGGIVAVEDVIGVQAGDCLIDAIPKTAIANNLDPYAYLTYIFTEAPKMAANGEDWVEAMLPQNAPDSCKAGKKERAQA